MKETFPLKIILPVLGFSLLIGGILNLAVGLNYQGWVLVSMDVVVVDSLALGFAVLISLHFTRQLIERSQRTFLVPLLSSGLLLGTGIIAFLGFFLSSPTSFLYADNRAVNYLLINLLFFLALNIIANGFLVFQQRLIEQEKTLSEEKRLKTQMELNLLTSKVNQHFLFYSLNLMVSLLKQPDQAETALINLSEILRYQLDFSENHTVPLAAELTMVEKYLVLQQMRFGERLQYHFNGQADGRIPPLILQPLVENAIKHNLNHVERLEITVSVVQTDSELTLSVIDSVAALVPEMLNQGMGLSITRKRVELAGGQFRIENGGITMVFKS